jgi:hypothetical protein
MHTNALGRQSPFDKNNFSVASSNATGFEVERVDLQYI